MKKTLCAVVVILFFITLDVYGGVIGTYPRKAMFIEKMVYSPDGKKVALQARDKANYYRRNAFVYIGSSRNGRFKKLSNVPVSNISWIDNKTIAFREKGTSIFVKRSAPAIVVKAIDIKTRRLETLYTLPSQTIPGSGGQTAVTNYYAISPGARFLLVQIGKQYILEDMAGRRAINLPGFKVPYSSNPVSQVRFFGRDGIVLFDGNARRYLVYRFNGRRLRLQKTITSMGRLKPSGNFSIDDGGKFIIFSTEVCRGGCRNEIYRYNLRTNRLSRKIMTVRGSQVLRLVFSKQQNQVLVNDFHRWLKRYPLSTRN